MTKNSPAATKTEVKGRGETTEEHTPQWSPFLRSLEVFLAVATLKSFSRAAEQLDISQPTVSQRIQGLECSVGVELFHRGRNEVTLTQAGHTLVTYAERLLNLRDEMMAELRGIKQLQLGILRVGASTTPGSYIMPGILHSFRQQYPGLKVVMQISDSERVLEMLRDSEVEVGIIGGNCHDSIFLCECLIEDELVIVCRPDHPLAGREDVAPEELGDYGWVVRERTSGTQRTVDELLSREKIGKRLRVTMVLSSTEAVKMAVLAGSGIALVSRRAIEADLKLGHLALARLAGRRLSRTFHLVRLQHRTLSPAAQALWDHLVGPRRLAG